MQYNQTNNPLKLDDVLPSLTTNPVGRTVKTAIEKTLGLSYLANSYNRLDRSSSPAQFVSNAFNLLDINYQIVTGQISNIPASGAAIVVSNHPFGAVDGMAMIELLSQRRSDIKVMANGILKRIPEISDVVLSVNPYRDNSATKENVAAMRECLNWLNQGGLVFMFPAGDVSDIQFKKLSIADNEWDNKVARLAIKAKASVTPVHFEGRNSAVFYLASAIHPGLKTLMLPRQIINKRGSSLKLHIGQSIATQKLQKLEIDQIVSVLKTKTYLLSERKPVTHTTFSTDLTASSIAPVLPEKLLSADIQSLDKQLLLESGDMQVFYASAGQIPFVLQEIGRLRETSFRLVGEGSGQPLDLDTYDHHYLQLFIWNKKCHEVVGGYRLGLTDKIIRDKGIKGLYCHSLFKINRAFFNNNNKSIELGRSFVRPEYQKSFSPLMLLWKGILQFVYQHPKYTVLFGPVSISNDYESTSKDLIINYLKKNHSHKFFKKLVKARTPYKKPKNKNAKLSLLNNLSIDDISALISSIEEDGKGMPVLIKQYLKLNGKMLSFNRDADFGDCIDGFIRVDLRQANEKNLAKYMGKDQTKHYRSLHNNKIMQTTRHDFV